MRSVIQVGDTVGPFTIVSKLGRGGMSTVYNAYETALDREVALKVLPIDLLEEPGFTERFEREARLIAKLEHPHIVPLYNYGIDDGVPWMALRLVRGGHLGERLERDTIGREAGLAYFTMVADALDHAHSLGVVHRDLKPQNVLLGEHGELYLADFGISRMLQGRTTITSTGAVLGTPQYMSPEQAQDSQVGPATDIYALGVMVYQWMTGVLPFDADTPYAVMYKHVNAPLAMEPLEPFPERSREVVGRALEKQSDQRWPSAGKFIEELAGALGVQEVPGQVLAAGKLPSSVAAAISARKLSRVPAAPTEYMGNAAGDTPPAGMRTPRSSPPTPRSGANPPVAPTIVQASASPEAPTSRGRAVPPGGSCGDGGGGGGGNGNGPATPGELQFRPRVPPPPKKKMDPKLLGIGTGVALLLLLVLAWALSGSDEETVPEDEAAVAAAAAAAAADVEATPEAAAEPPPLPAGDARLLMESDLACELSINGVRRGSLQAMTPLRLELAPGRYQLACAPPAHPDIVSSQVATVVREEPTVALFELKYEIEERERQRQAAERRKKEKAEAESQARQRQEDKEAAEARRLIEQARQREEDRVAEEERKLQEARNVAERRRREEAIKLDEARRAAAARRSGGTPARTEVAAPPDAAEQARQAKARRDAEARRQAEARQKAEAEEAARQAAAAQVAAAATAAPAPAPKRLTPIPVNTPQPSYPPDALRSGTTGDVQVEITIGRDGQVKDVRILQARPRGSFEREVIATVRTWRYEPLDEEVKLSRTFLFK